MTVAAAFTTELDFVTGAFFVTAAAVSATTG